MTGSDKMRELADAAATRVVERTDPRPGRRWLLVWVATAVLLLSLVGGATYFVVRLNQADAAARQLAEQVEDLGGVPVVQPPGRDDPDPNDPDPDDPDPDDAERQDAEAQDPEVQDTEVQDPEVQESEVPDVERDDPDPDDPEVQDPEIQDPEIDDPPATGPQGPIGPPGPTCPPGYTARSRTYDPSPIPGDEETWWVCVADRTEG